MAIYDLGTASLAEDGEVTGVGTTWKAPLTLIRVGATIVFKTEPVKIYTISEIISDTQINVYNPNSETVPAGTGYAILAHDGITVQGLAQDVAETLRYYQSRETEVADAVDAFNNFDSADFESKVTQVNTQHGDVVSIGAQVSADATQVTADKDAAAASANIALSAKDAAATSAQEAADYAASLDTSNLLRKDLSLSDLTDKPLARENLDVYSKLDSLSQYDAFYHGVKFDGSDTTNEMESFVQFINNIPNPDGTPIGVVFRPGIVNFSRTAWFTRPVSIICEKTVFKYSGDGNAFILGPDGLSGDYSVNGVTPYHKEYGFYFGTFEGGTTGGSAIHFSNWVPDCRVFGVSFRYFGGNGSHCVTADYNNWLTTVAQCVFWGHNDSVDDVSNVRNFVRTRGFKYLEDNSTKVSDLWSTRLHAIDNRLFGVGYRHAGNGYLISGWKSRVSGGSSEGLFSDIIISAGCNDVEISNFYVEKGFASTSPSIPVNVIVNSYDGDPHVQDSFLADGGAGNVSNAATRFVKRTSITNSYFNMHNNEHDSRFMVNSNPLYVSDLFVDNCSFVHSYHELFNVAEVTGNTGWKIGSLSFDGSPELTSRLLEPSYASIYKTSYDKDGAKNLIKNPIANSIVSGYEGALPVSTNFGTTGISMQSDGSGGAYRLTKRNTTNSDSGSVTFERLRLDNQSAVFDLSCSSAGNGNYLHLNLSTNESPFDIQGTDCCLSFYAKAYNEAYGSVNVGGFIRTKSGSYASQSVNTVSVPVGDQWFKYFLYFKNPQLQHNSTASYDESCDLTISLPASSRFYIEIASPCLNYGSYSKPLQSLSK